MANTIIAPTVSRSDGAIVFIDLREPDGWERLEDLLTQEQSDAAVENSRIEGPARTKRRTAA